jgi:hypothetical protein
MDAVQRTHRYADVAQAVAFNPVGQIVGMMNQTESVRAVVYRLVEEYLEASERLQRLTAAGA